MTKEALNEQLELLDQKEEEINTQISKERDEILQLHLKKQELYKVYIDEVFPFKVGDKAIHNFINNQGDRIIRNITINAITISGSSIRINYTYISADGRTLYSSIFNVNEDGTVNRNNKLLKSDKSDVVE